MAEANSVNSLGISSFCPAPQWTNSGTPSSYFLFFFISLSFFKKKKCVCLLGRDVCIGQKRKLTLLSFRLTEVGWARHGKKEADNYFSNAPPPPPQQMPHTLGSFSGGEVRIKTNFFCSRGNTVLSLDESNFHSFDVSALFPLQTNTITKSIVHSRLETRWTFKNIYTTNVLTFSSELYVGPHIFGGSCRRTTNDEPDISFFFLCRDNNSTF